MKNALVFALAGFVMSFGALAYAQGPPSLCKPCLFHGGDYNPTDPNSSAFPDENTVTYINVHTYGAIILPPHHSINVSGILFQIQFQNPNNKLDPNGASWEIRSGVTEGSGGVLIASGSGPVAKEPTGRFGDGSEFTVRVKINPIQLSSGTKETLYWFNLTPQCTNQNDPVCNSSQYFVSNTTDHANGFHWLYQADGRIIVNSDSIYYPYQWEDWCQLGLNGTQCGYLSFGLTGSAQ